MLSEMESGECRWVGDYDIHVYCRHHARRIEREAGGVVYLRDPADRRYAIACPDAGLDCEEWMDEDAAQAVVDRIVLGRGIEIL